MGFAACSLHDVLKKASEDNLNNPVYDDTMISAEIPLESDQELWEVVLQHSIKNPCGDLNPFAIFMGKSDMEDIPNFCSKHFAKLTEEVIYVIYLWCNWTFIYQIGTQFILKKVKNIALKIYSNADPSYPDGS